MIQFETKSEPRKFTDAEVAIVIKVFRLERGWTQEVLAELCRVDVRTIQRAERGDGVGEGSLRAIARELGFTDKDFLNKDHRIPTPEEVDAATAKFEKEHLILETTVATSARELANVYEGSFADVSNPDTSLSADAADEYAALVDFLHDYRDLTGEIGEVEKVDLSKSLQEILDRVHATGIDVCYATRAGNFRFTGDKDQAPMHMKLVYLAAFPRGQVPAKIAVTKNVNFG